MLVGGVMAFSEKFHHRELETYLGKAVKSADTADGFEKYSCHSFKRLKT
jgi:hypothetical protein